MSSALVIGIHHAAIAIPDMDAALAFYVDRLGLELTWRGEWSGSRTADDAFALEGSAGQIAMLRSGGASLELFQFDAPAAAAQDPHRPVNERGYTHIAFDVRDVDSAYAELSAAGVHFQSPVQRSGGTKFVYGRDPFGNVFELKQAGGPATT
jgi:catechol 2,3-dioxygenase-like lactoylglutathione lyase family enzyme